MRVALGLVCVLSGSGCDRVFALGPPPGADSPRGLVFENADSPVDLVDFPVLVPLDPSVIDYEVVVEPRTDLRFHDPDTGTDLAFDVDHWEPGGESFVWVRVPLIDAGSNTDGILLYFGRGVATTAHPASDTWSAYDLVYHAEDDRNAAGADYAADRREGSSLEPGFIGSALKLSDQAADSRVDFPGSMALLGGSAAFTLELSIHPDYDLATLPSPGMPVGTNPDERAVLTMEGPLYLGRLRNLTDSGPLIMQLDIAFEVGQTVNSFQYTPHQVWSHLVYTFDGTTLLMYRNGIFSDFAYRSPRLGGAGNDLYLGSDGNPMNGRLDELRISRQARTPAWVYAQFLSLTRRFITIVPGDEL